MCLLLDWLARSRVGSFTLHARVLGIVPVHTQFESRPRVSHPFSTPDVNLKYHRDQTAKHVKHLQQPQSISLTLTGWNLRGIFSPANHVALPILVPWHLQAAVFSALVGSRPKRCSDTDAGKLGEVLSVARRGSGTDLGTG